MRSRLARIVLAMVTLLLTVGPGSSTWPYKTFSAAGFPGGSHFRLDIVGEGFGFRCPEPKFNQFGKPVYGNMVFVPENGKRIEIYAQFMKTDALSGLQVIDPCARFDGDGVVFQLPENHAGYCVFARALAKPSYGRRIASKPTLTMVEDENGTLLIYLGELSSKGFQTIDGHIFSQKGRSGDLNITRLFQWQGLMCSVDAPYEEGLNAVNLCGKDADLDGTPDDFKVAGSGACPSGYGLFTLYCKEYLSPTWVFSIRAFMDYLWRFDHRGQRMLEIRFYPKL